MKSILFEPSIPLSSGSPGIQSSPFASPVSPYLFSPHLFSHPWAGTLEGVALVGASIVLGISALPAAQAAEWPSETHAPKMSSPLPSPNLAEGRLPRNLDSLGVSFDLAPLPAVAASPSSHPSPQSELSELPREWWHQGSESPIAIAIGLAEGTRTLEGGKTAAYYWHADPGNGADNYGTFSYQHLPPSLPGESAATKRQASAEKGLPEQADRLQLQRLETFYQQLQHQALAKGLQLTELELLNGLDLANQSEAAALSPWGYVDRLAQMRDLLPNQPDAQIQEARTWAYWSPDRQTWDAPGLGNTYASIQRDQVRRFAAVKQALQGWQAGSLASPRSWDSSKPRQSSPRKDLSHQNDRAMAILFFQESS